MTAAVVGPFGGMAPKVPLRNLPDTMAQLALDVDLEAGSLKPWRTDKMVQTAGANARTLMYEECCAAFNAGCIDYARQTLPCLRYYRTGVAAYVEVADSLCGTWKRLGLPCDIHAPSVTLLTALQRTEQKVIDRRFIFVFVDSNGNESGGSRPSDSIVGDWDQQILISGFTLPAATYDVARIHIYATAPELGTGDSSATPVDPGTTFYQIADIPATQTSFLWTPDADSFGDVYLNDEFDEPPTDLRNIQWFGTNQLAGLSGGMLFTSRPNKYHAWPRSFAMGFESPALRMVATDKFGYILTCGKPASVDLRQDCKDGRCHSAQEIDYVLPLVGERSAARCGDQCVYASDDGLVLLSGQQAVILTTDLFTRDQWLALHPNRMVGAYHKGYYFGSTDVGTIRLRIPDGIRDKMPRANLTMLSMVATAFYESSDGRLYFANADGVKEWNAGNNQRAYLWRSGVLKTNGEIMQALQLTQECFEDAEVSLIVAGCPDRRWTRTVGHSDAFTVPPWLRGQALQIEIGGTSEVTRAKLASSKSELSRLT